jgi:hypothetical protein
MKENHKVKAVLVYFRSDVECLENICFSTLQTWLNFIVI